VLATLRALPAIHPGEAKRPRKGRPPEAVIGASLPEPEDIPQFNDGASNASNPITAADTLEAI
jgi:hypothetical protein